MNRATLDEIYAGLAQLDGDIVDLEGLIRLARMPGCCVSAERVRAAEALLAEALATRRLGEAAIRAERTAGER